MLKIDRTELVWPGKYDENGNRKEVERVNLPFQVIETINETRATRESKKSRQPSLFDIWEAKEGDTFEGGWKNKLIWGDNKYVMSSLLEKFAGRINLIYIDPPFATGADFSINVEVGDVELTKEASAVEEKAYRDTWGKGIDSYLTMMYDRLVLMRELLAEDGSIYVHMDWHVGHYVKLIIDEIFGKENFRNEIYCKRVRKNVQEYETAKRINVALDIILFYAKSDSHRIIQPRSEVSMGERWHAFDAPEVRTGMDYELFGVKPPPSRHWMWEKEKAEEAIKQGILRRNSKTGKPEYRVISENPILSTLWDDIPAYSFEHGFDTEKSEKLLSRIIKASSNEGDLVADFFCGSGTTCAVAEKLGRRWIGCDLSRFAIHTTRKRLLEIENCKPFEILNLGKYERKYWQGITFGGKRQEQQLAIFEYLKFILKLYGAEPLAGMQHLHGKKGNAVVHVGAVDAPVTIDEINSCLDECIAIKQKELHVLGWEWEMGINNLMVDEAKGSGVKLVLRTIPREVMEQQAVDKGDIHFFELAFLEVDIQQTKKQEVVVELKDFVISNTDLIPEDVREKIKKWSDYIDYWAVDWDFQNDTFMNGWVAYRTRKDRTLSLKSDPHIYEKPGKYTIVVKVIDIFGIDTSQTFEVEVK